MSKRRSQREGETGNPFRDGQYGVTLQVEHEQDGVHVLLTPDGHICDLDPVPRTPADMVATIACINGALATAKEFAARSWWETATCLSEAMEMLPLEQRDPELAAELRKSVIRWNSTIPITAGVVLNALPEILSVDIDLQQEDEDILVTLGYALFRALEGLKRLRPEIIERHGRNVLQDDIRRCCWLRDEIRSRVSEWDTSRMLAIASAGGNAGPYLRISIPLLLQQAEAVGKRVDMLLGLNHGANLDAELAELQAQGIPVRHLHTNAERSSGKGLPPFLLETNLYRNSELLGEPEMIAPGQRGLHSVTAIHQQPTARSAGKNPMLKVLTGAFIDSVIRGRWGKVPAHTLEFDAETQLLPGDCLAGNGLAALLEEKERRKLEIIGARSRSVRFRLMERGGLLYGLPDHGAPVDPLHKVLDAAQGKFLYIMPGGGTLGNTAVMAALRGVICYRHPGSRDEDLHRTVYANQSGMAWGIAEGTDVLNESRGVEQLQRWYRAARGLREVLGNDAFTGVTDSKGLLAEAELRGVPHEVIDRIRALIADARSNPDALDGDAAWDA